MSQPNTQCRIRGLIGVVHLPPMPGDPLFESSYGFEGVIQRAFDDAKALVEGGVDGLIIENFGSVPFPKGSRGSRLPAHQVSALSLVCRECTRSFEVPVGVNCLRNDAMSAVGIAAATGAAFVRVNVHTGAYVTDQGLIEGEAAETLRYRRSLGAEVSILADVLVKHGSPVVPLGVEQAVEEALQRGLADAVIITGATTGAAVARDRLAEARRAARDAPVFIGSGFEPGLVEELAPLADGAIVGTWLKGQGDVRQPVDPERVRRLVSACRGRFLHS